MSNKVLKLASVEESIQNEDIRECLQIVIDEAAMQKAFMDIVKIDGPCQAADYIVCDVDGKELKIELGKNYYGELEEELVGMKAGDIKGVSGKTITMKSVKRKMVPENVTDSEKKINRYIEEEKKDRLTELVGMMTDYLMENSEFGDLSEEINAIREEEKELLDSADEVHILGKDTDITFSIKGIGAVKCDGRMNIPDGEVYTAPVRESVNGKISYNTASVEGGFKYENIQFEVRDGRIVRATSNDDARINEFLDADEGARYFGEFALGVNPYILSPMNDTLFDEKIAGSFHLTPGMCYEDAPNGNSSANHWDLVMIQRPEYGGGEIWIDGQLIRKDGIFTLPELQYLNPEYLGR